MNELGISYLDGFRFRRALIAGCDHVQKSRVELNSINVFPVPDGDTGTNLGLTLAAIRDHLVGHGVRHLGQSAQDAAHAAVLGARGNSGMLLSHFLVGFASYLKELPRASSATLASAFRAGAARLEEALSNPVEGTILTVARAGASAALSSPHADIVTLIETVVGELRAALVRTTDQLAVLKDSGVVDAGAKGFVLLFEGILRLIHTGDTSDAVDSSDFAIEPVSSANIFAGPDPTGGRFCTEVLIRSVVEAKESEVADLLTPLGNDVLVLRSSDVVKVHIHTDEPEDVYRVLGRFGEVVTKKAEDIWAQHDTIVGAHGELAEAVRPVVFVADSACDLPELVVRAHGIHIVPQLLIDGGRVLRDGVDITGEQFAQRMTDGGELPTTSQPAPADFLSVYRAALLEGKEVISFLLSSKLSGTYASGEAAAKETDGGRITTFDSRGASLLQGLLLLRAVEMAEAGQKVSKIVERIAELRNQSGMFLTVRTLDRLTASGRVSRPVGRIGGLLGICPTLEVTQQGTVELTGKPLGPARARRRIIRALCERLDGVSRPTFGIVHVGCVEIAESVRDELKRLFPESEILLNNAASVIATHTGVGAWGLAYVPG